MGQQMRMAKQLMDLQKVTFDGMINNMIIFWDQTGRMLSSYFDQAPWMQDDARKAFQDWIDGNKKGCETFQYTVSDGFKRLESYLAGKTQETDQ